MSKDLVRAPSHAKHREGPWECRLSTSANQCEVVSREGYVIAIFPRSRPNATANARLIAAAPDLLALLTEAMDSRAPDLADAHHPGWHDRARSAIAKASGAGI